MKPARVIDVALLAGALCGLSVGFFIGISLLEPCECEPVAIKSDVGTIMACSARASSTGE